MRNPFRSEADAFRFVWLTIGYFALIVAGSVIASWVGLAVFLVLTGAALWSILRRGRPEVPVAQVPAESPPGEHRILVVANETVGGHALLAEIRSRSAGRNAVVLVLCPALNSPLRHWVSDEDEARAAASARLDQSLASMRAAGLDATGKIGDGDPIQAIEDALRTFRPDELVISTHPLGRSHWLERGVVEKARERFALPVTHVVVDLDA
ncbi:MAG TPA: universal stress protein [Gaiellaceae bacterium]|nr:universal stress protein [Gaiellaceae bacterium]